MQRVNHFVLQLRRDPDGVRLHLVAGALLLERTAEWLDDAEVEQLAHQRQGAKLGGGLLVGGRLAPRDRATELLDVERHLGAEAPIGGKD